MRPADTDISEELALLEGLLIGTPEPASSRRSDVLAKSALVTGALIPTVLGAIAAGAAELEAPLQMGSATQGAPLPTAHTSVDRGPRVFVPIQRTAQVPFTAEHQPTVERRGTPTFSLSPRFKALMAAERGVTVRSGRAQAAALYRVAPGDSLYVIAKRLLGNGARWRELYAANKGKLASPSLLRVGMALSMPASPAASPIGDLYRVARGDSLYVIAARKLKNPARWHEIAALNRSELRGGTVIHPRQVLLLPTV